MALTLIVNLTACASLSTHSRRFLMGAGTGFTLGGLGGYAASPNEASRPWNGLIFGLSGALAGGLVGLWTAEREVPSEQAQRNLKQREESADALQVFATDAPPSASIPDYLKDRISSLVIEEMKMPDRVGDDGTLHEPHKAYRIKRQPELLPKPVLKTPMPVEKTHASNGTQETEK